MEISKVSLSMNSCKRCLDLTVRENWPHCQKQEDIWWNSLLHFKNTFTSLCLIKNLWKETRSRNKQERSLNLLYFLLIKPSLLWGNKQISKINKSKCANQESVAVKISANCQIRIYLHAQNLEENCTLKRTKLYGEVKSSKINNLLGFGLAGLAIVLLGKHNGHTWIKLKDYIKIKWVIDLITWRLDLLG